MRYRWVWLLIIPVLALTFFAGRMTVKPVRLVEERLVRVIERIPYEVQKIVTVRLPGAREKVPVVVERVREIVREKPVERIVVHTGPVYCKTREECDRIYQAAEQRIEVTAALREGTVVPVRRSDTVENLPLASDFPLSLRLVLSQGGVFHALEPSGSPLRISEVRTETILPPKTKPEPSRWDVRGLVGWSSLHGGLAVTEIDYRLDKHGPLQGWLRVATEYRWQERSADLRAGLVATISGWTGRQFYALASAQEGFVTGFTLQYKVGRWEPLVFNIRLDTERAWLTNRTDYRVFLTATW